MKIKSVLFSAGLVLAFLTAAHAADDTTPVSAGATVRLAVECNADATRPLTFEFYRGEERLATQEVVDAPNQAQYVVTNFDATKAGAYWVKVQNTAGTAISDRVNLVLAVAPTKPTIKVTFAVLTVPKQSSVSLGVEAQGAKSFVWYRNGLPLSGQTAATLYLWKVRPNQAGRYSIVGLNGSLRSEWTDVADIRVN